MKLLLGPLLVLGALLSLVSAQEDEPSAPFSALRVYCSHLNGTVSLSSPFNERLER